MKQPPTKIVATTSLDVAQLRLMTRAALLHHMEGARQVEIAEKLGISQAGVSRLLRMAEAHGIIRKIVVPPDGLFPELEEQLLTRFCLSAAYVVDIDPTDPSLARSLGLAAARLLANEIADCDVLGFTSWSSTLREMARHMVPVAKSRVKYVAETLGDLGSPMLQHEADVATLQMSEALGAGSAFLRVPGVVASPDLRKAVEQDVHIRTTLNMLNRADRVLVGLGPVDFHGPLAESENFFSRAQLAQLRQAGAVSQLHQRFIDIKGRPVITELDERVIGMTLAQLRNVKQRIVVAGGKQKREALIAALAGKWIDVLLTDVDTARYLLGTSSEKELF